VKVPLDSVLPIEEAEKAHARIRENKNVGKIVLTL
jgi:NADPH:quinone reductase-like Zn-dependent oxidoreductase